MPIRARMKACIEELKQRWEAEGFVRKADKLVRVRPLGVDMVLFTPPGSWRMDIQVFLESWDARLASFLDGRAVDWPRKRFPLPDHHYSRSVVKMMAPKRHYIGEDAAAQAGFGSSGLADYIWSYSPQLAAWFEHHADPAWLADELARRARLHVERYESDPRHEFTNTWGYEDFTWPAMYGRLVGRDDLLPEMKALHQRAATFRQSFGTPWRTDAQIEEDGRRAKTMWQHVEGCVRVGPYLLPPPGGTGVELQRWRRRRHVESLKSSLEGAGFVPKGAHNMARVAPHGLEVVLFTPLAKLPSNGIQLSLAVWNAQLAAVVEGSELDWPRKRFKFPEAHEVVPVATLLGLEHPVIEESDADAAGFDGELDAYIWSSSKQLLAWFETRAAPSWLAERLPDSEAVTPPWWEDDLQRLLGPRMSSTQERAVLERFRKGDDPWGICEAALRQCPDLKGKALERASALLHTLLPKVDDLSGLAFSLEELLSRKPKATVARKVGSAMSSIVLRREYLCFAATLLRARKHPSTAAQTVIRESLTDWRADNDTPHPLAFGLTVLMLQRVRTKGAATSRKELHMALLQWDSDGGAGGVHRCIWALEICTPPKKYTGWQSWEQACLSRLPRSERERLMSDFGFDGRTDDEATARELSPGERKSLEDSESALIDDWLLGLETG